MASKFDLECGFTGYPKWCLLCRCYSVCTQRAFRLCLIKDKRKRKQTFRQFRDFDKNNIVARLFYLPETISKLKHKIKYLFKKDEYDLGD